MNTSAESNYTLKKSHVWMFFIVAAIAYFAWQGVLELRAEEPRRAVVSMEMAHTGQYAAPTLNGTWYFGKPPLFNWVLASTFKLTGSTSEAIVRLPSLLAFFALAYLLFVVMRRHFGRTEGLISAVILLTFGDVMLYGAVNSGEIDLFYALLTSVQLYTIYHFTTVDPNKFKLFLCSYAVCVLAFLTKGPPAILFQGLTLFAYSLYTKRFRQLISWQHLLGIIILIGSLTLYFRIHEAKTGESLNYIRTLFWQAGEKAGRDRSFLTLLTGWATYPLGLLKITLPWSLFLIPLLSRKFRERWNLDRFAAFCVLAIIVNIPIYWISGRFVARYIYMFLPLIAVLLTKLILMSGTRTNKVTGIALYILLTLSVLASIGAPLLEHLSVTGNVLVNILPAALLLIITSLIAWKNREFATRILMIGMLLIGIRLLYNGTYLRYSDHKLEYRENTERFHEMVKGQTIHITGAPRTFAFEKQWFLPADTTMSSPVLPYQISYYLNRLQDEPVVFDTEMRPGYAYLATDGVDRSRNHFQLEGYYDNWQKQAFSLYIFEE